jgi:hypothetical protein
LLPLVAAAAEIRWVGAPAVQVLIGHTDNALLSSVAPRASGFGETKVDTVWAHAPGDRWQVNGYAEATWRHYFASTVGTRNQGGGRARGEVRWSSVGRLTLGAVASAFGETTVVDFSETTDTRLIAVARTRGGALAALGRFALHRTLTLQANARTSRVDYRTFAGDHIAREPSVRLEWQPLPRISLHACRRVAMRDYVDRPRYTAGGRVLAGTRLALRQDTTEAEVQVALAARGTTQVGLRGSRGETRDGGSGYFDHRIDHGSLRLEHRQGVWRWRGEFGRQTQVYRVQTGGTGIAPPARRARRHQFEFQVERKFAPGRTLLASFAREAERGNLAEFNYRAATVSGGLRLSF